jgi:hypothetical protein
MVDPPGEGHEELHEHALEECQISCTVDLALEVEKEVGGPGVNRRIYITEVPLVRRQLTVGMHVVLAQHELKLLLGEI